MRVLVLGAGVIGVTTAWELVNRGCTVTVVDRQPDVAMETSYANGGQISVSHAEPWANPHTPKKALSWLGRPDAPLLFHCRFDPALMAWCLAFLRQCLPGNTRHNIRAIVEMALYSRSRLQALRQELGEGPVFDYDQQTRGILHFYTNAQEYRSAVKAAAVMREYGCDRRLVDTDECIAIEPALADASRLIVGGDFHAADESGDARRFTQLLAKRALERGVEYSFNTRIISLATDRRSRVTHLVVERGQGNETIDADVFIVALGSYSPLLVKPLGIRLPIYPAKGYSLTFPLDEDSRAPWVSLTDDGAKLVFSRLGNRLRVAGTAEFAGYNLDLQPPRLVGIERRVKELFPQLAAIGKPDAWCGLRPATPSNVPVIGRSRIENLWVNSGHGTLGWTLACGSARLLADSLCTGKNEIDLPIDL